MPNYIGATLEPTQANAYSFTNSYLEGRRYSSTFLTQLDDSIDSRYDSSLFTISLGSLSQNLYSQGLISGKAYGYLQALSSSLNQFANDSATAGAYDSLCQDITSQEDYVLRDSTFMQSTIESRMVLSTMAIGRYSVGYWMNFHNSTQSVGGAVQACGWFSWSAVAGGDVVGAAAGALGGGAAGALAGGIGAGPGAVAGGLGGGISCSAYEAGMQIWHHFFK